jgi:hypothetical protein
LAIWTAKNKRLLDGAILIFDRHRCLPKFSGHRAEYRMASLVLTAGLDLVALLAGHRPFPGKGARLGFQLHSGLSFRYTLASRTWGRHGRL